MKTIVCTKPGLLEYRDDPAPAGEAGMAIIRIRRVGICGTDLHAFEGTQPFFQYPRVLGHELAGELVDTGGAEGFKVGEQVTIIPYLNCGTCITCRTGKPNCCVNMRVCGVHQDGGMREYFSVPSHALMHGHGLDLDALALVEPLAIGAHGVRRAGVSPGQFVLVVGAGPIGLGVMAFAQLAGGDVIAMDLSADKLRFCREQLGVKHTVQVGNSDVMEALRDITKGDMPSVVIDATGSLKAIQSAFTYLAHGGVYVLVGLQKGDIAFSHPEFHKREATLMSSRNATRVDFEQVMKALTTGAVKPSAFITHRVGFGAVAGQFDSWLRPETGVIKAMVNVEG